MLRFKCNLTFSIVIIAIVTFLSVNVRSYPDSAHVSCDLNAATPSGSLATRPQVMNLPVKEDCDAIATLITNSDRYFIQISDSTVDFPSFGFLVHTSKGQLKAVSGTQTHDLKEGDTCPEDNDIAYSVGYNSVLEFVPSDGSDLTSIVRVFGSDGKGNTKFCRQQFVLSDAIAGDLPAGAENENDDGEGDDEQDAQQIVFGITVSFLTLGYVYFLWDTLQPLKACEK